MAEKKYRIAKVAAELNVGFEALLDHLASKGHEVERKVTAKISSEMYELLLDEFRSDKDFKEKSKIHDKAKKESSQKLREETKKTVSKTDEKEILIKNTSLSESEKEESPKKEEAPEKEPEKKMPSTAAKASKRVAKLASSE